MARPPVFKNTAYTDYQTPTARADEAAHFKRRKRGQSRILTMLLGFSLLTAFNTSAQVGGGDPAQDLKDDIRARASSFAAQMDDALGNTGGSGPGGLSFNDFFSPNHDGPDNDGPNTLKMPRPNLDAGLDMDTGDAPDTDAPFKKVSRFGKATVSDATIGIDMDDSSDTAPPVQTAPNSGFFNSNADAVAPTAASTDAGTVETQAPTAPASTSSASDLDKSSSTNNSPAPQTAEAEPEAEWESRKTVSQSGSINENSSYGIHKTRTITEKENADGSSIEVETERKIKVKQNSKGTTAEVDQEVGVDHRSADGTRTRGDIGVKRDKNGDIKVDTRGSIEMTDSQGRRTTISVKWDKNGGLKPGISIGGSKTTKSKGFSIF